VKYVFAELCCIQMNLTFGLTSVGTQCIGRVTKYYCCYVTECGAGQMQDSTTMMRLGFAVFPQ